VLTLSRVLCITTPAIRPRFDDNRRLLYGSLQMTLLAFLLYGLLAGMRRMKDAEVLVLRRRLSPH
jgi:hypothetical protein